MSVLKDPLVLKYFGLQPNEEIPKGWPVEWLIAFRILQASTKVLKKGDKILMFDYITGKWIEGFSHIGYAPRPDHLLIPSAFQPSPQPKPEKIEMKCSCGFTFTHDCKEQNQPTPEAPKSCRHDGLKRYCGDAVYCELCKVDISHWLAKCTRTLPHDGPCEIDRKPDEIADLIQQIKLDVYAKVQADATVDMNHLAKQLDDLVAIVKRTGDADKGQG